MKKILVSALGIICMILIAACFKVFAEEPTDSGVHDLSLIHI